MGLDKYKVEILHYVNPHLIWALVEEEGPETSHYFEQIGIYGILPINVEIDYEGNITSRRCEQWLPAVFVAMKKILLDASEVWFSVNFLDKTTSIFDDNVHKYGDLTIKMKDGKTISLLERLLETGFVAEDVQYFHQNLNTKLDYVNTITVIDKIKKSLKSLNTSYKYLDHILNSQLSVFQQAVELEETISPRNLDISNRQVHAQVLLRKQVHDLNACKDVDEVSAGRASSLNAVKSPSNRNTGLTKKLNMVKSKDINSDLKSVLPITKNNIEIVNNLQSNNKSVDIDNVNTDHESQKPINNKYYKKGKHPKVKNNNNDKKLIAYGPAGLNLDYYQFKEVAAEEQLLKEENRTEKIEPEDDAKHEMFDKTDSEVNIRLSKLDILRMKRKPYKADNHNIVNNSNENNETKNCAQDNIQNENPKVVKQASSSIHLKMKILKEKMAKLNDSSSTADTDSALRQGDDSDSESISALVDKLDLSSVSTKKEVITDTEILINDIKHNVNPFKNLDGSQSVFVEKLVSPTLMVHTKKGNRIQPVTSMRDLPFGTDIHVVLRNMSVKKPMRPQTVSWPTILRGHSLFLVSPYGSGKTMGYLPAVCRLVSDSKNSAESLSVSPLTCIILCATANSVSNVEDICKMLLHEARIFACYAGMSDMTITTSILNGCDILICTPIQLVRLIRDNLGLELRNLSTFVIDDCERISEVYQNELKFCMFKVREMLKARVNKEVKVQYVVASRIWCSFMTSLARKAPDSIVCIGAFQECVLYSEVDTSVKFLKKDKKVDAVIKFLENIDKSKKTVIACRTDNEVHVVTKALTNLSYVVFACDSTMTVHDLYSLDLALSDYQEPLLGPILVCCDGNLTHLNITDAHYLIHFSLPEMLSTFSKRFAVLIDNYSSIFDNQESDVKIKILLEDSNVEQLPKILHFIKRCSDNLPSVLDEISTTVMSEKDLKKAQSFVPLCNSLLSLGKCPDIWHCKHRHAIFQEFDEPSPWIPKKGTISFKILHYHSAVHYSARMISCTTNNGVKRYPQTYSMLSIKLGMYYSKDVNRKLHGVAKPGDVCALSLKHNLFARCQVVKILKYTHNNTPNLLLINLIDEEKYEMARDTCLYYLPDDLKKIESHAVKVILDNLAPQDRDITYSRLAEDQLKNITEQNDEVYMRGRISLVIGNCIFVETLEACQDLSALNETVVKSNFKNELLDGYAINNPDHISVLQKLGEHLDFMRNKEVKEETIEVPKPIKTLPKANWAHLETDTHVPVYYLYAKTPELFFVQHVKFQDCLNILIRDIEKYVSENPQPVHDVKEGDIVLAEFPDDVAYERARIDSVIDSNKVKCFFVDLGDWRVVSIDKLLSITEKMITQLPFQAIECRLVGIKPLGDVWSEFSTNWLVDQFYDTSGNLKYLFAVRFTKEKAEFTEGGKYGVALIDTYADDVCINKLMLNANLAEENDEIEFLTNINLDKGKAASFESNSTDETSLRPGNEKVEAPENKSVPENMTSAVGSTSKVILEAAAKLASFAKDLDRKDTNGISKSSNSFPESNTQNQLTLKNAFQGAHTSTPSNSSSDYSKENVRTNQQAIMSLFRNTPLRSVPLVDNDDVDDDRWDSQNPVFMLMDRNQGTSKVTEVSAFDTKKEPKIVPPAINNSRTNDTESKPEYKATKSAAALDRQPNETTPLKTSTRQLNKTSVSKPVADKNYTSDNNKENQESNIFWSILERENTVFLYDKSSANGRKIKLVWSQEISSITIQIKVITEKYELNIQDKAIQFYTNSNVKEYGFELELYGVIDAEKSTHSNRGTYIEIKLCKLMCKKWLKLNKGDVKKYVTCGEKSTDIAVAEDNRSKVRANDQEETSSKTLSAATLVNKSDTKINHTIQEVHKIDNLRKPKVIWRQNKYKVTVKIQLITEQYDLIIKEKYMKFSSNANDEEYGFGLELYGVVEVDKSSHSNKGQYIQVNLTKVMAKNWITLNKGNVNKWIVYDVDNIDVSSEDENESIIARTNLQKCLNINHESDSDDDFNDDTHFGYKKQY